MYYCIECIGVYQLLYLMLLPVLTVICMLMHSNGSITFWSMCFFVLYELVYCTF